MRPHKLVTPTLRADASVNNVITGWTTKATYDAADYLFNSPMGVIVANECLEYCSRIRDLSFEEQLEKIEAWLQVNLIDKLGKTEFIDWHLLVLYFY